MKKRRIVFFIIIIIFGIYFIWKYFPQGKLDIKEEALSVDTDVFIKDTISCSDWLIGVQPEMYAHHYQSAEAFYNRLNDHLKPLKEKYKHTGKSVIVFPEHIGTWLVAAEERNSVYTAKRVTDAMLPLVASHPIDFLKHYFSNLDVKDQMQASLFLSKASQTASIYQEVFSKLAKEYNAYIVAGSIILPSPVVQNNKIKLSGNELYNASFTFLPDGSIARSVTKKVFPVLDEQKFCKAGSINNIKTQASPFGNIGTLICADSWYPESFEKLDSLNTKIIAIPSYITGKIADKPWNGYNGFDAPANVDTFDVGKITEAEAWDKYAASGRIAPSAIGVNVFLRGQLWDMQSDGRSKLIINGNDYKTKSEGAVLLISCLPKEE